ncbi:DUF6214 family protein [Streptomyces albiaxialis]|uniref:DUF6214 family protein n=1 Tax=Streptomyces albiaxialis TaxID=329523 RepID=A0ABN2VM08_9ACTN
MWPLWELQGYGTATPDPDWAGRPGGAPDLLPPWFNVRLTFSDGSRIDILAAVADGQVTIEDMRAEPALPLHGFATLAGWISEPLEDACRVVLDQHAAGGTGYGGTDPRSFRHRPEPGPEEPAKRRARPAWPRGTAGRRVAAEAYLAAQEEGQDPVLAVMCATGMSRRKSLRIIASARDEGYLAPRHARR